MRSFFNRQATARAAVLVTLTTAATYALTLVTSALIARDLGPGDYGRYAYLVWLSGLLVAVANNGINVCAIRFVSEYLGRGPAEDAATVHWKLGRLQRASLLVVLAGFTIIALYFGRTLFGDYATIFTIVALVSVASRAVYLFDISVAKGYGAFTVEASSTASISALALLVTIGLHLTNSPLTAYAILYSLTSVAMYLVAAWSLRRRKLRPRRGELPADAWAPMRTHLLWSVVLVTAGALGSKSIETFLLNHFEGPEAVGYFSIAIALARGGTDLLTIGLTTVLMPTMGQAFGAGGQGRVNSIFADALRYFALFGLVLAGVGWFWSGPIVAFIYGPAFEEAGYALAVVAVIGGVSLLEAAVGSFLSTTGRQAVWAKAALSSLAMSGLASALLIPRYGLTGALISLGLSRLLPLAVLLFVAAKQHGAAVPYGALARLLAAAAIAAAAGALADLLPGEMLGKVVAGLVYAAAFLFGTLLLRAWRAEDAELIAAIANRYPRLAPVLRPLLGSQFHRFTSRGDTGHPM